MPAQCCGCNEPTELNRQRTRRKLRPGLPWVFGFAAAAVFMVLGAVGFPLRWPAIIAALLLIRRPLTNPVQIHYAVCESCNRKATALAAAGLLAMLALLACQLMVYMGQWTVDTTWQVEIGVGLIALSFVVAVLFVLAAPGLNIVLTRHYKGIAGYSGFGRAFRESLPGMNGWRLVSASPVAATAARGDGRSI